MSFDLAVFLPRSRMSADAAAKFYHTLCEGRALASLVDLPAAFYIELVAEYPELTDDDDSPWSAKLDRSARHVIMPIVWSRADEVAARVKHLAGSLGLSVYDPQRRLLLAPAAALREAASYKPPPKRRSSASPQNDLADALARLMAKRDFTRVVLDAVFTGDQLSLGDRSIDRASRDDRSALRTPAYVVGELDPDRGPAISVRRELRVVRTRRPEVRLHRHPARVRQLSVTYSAQKVRRTLGRAPIRARRRHSTDAARDPDCEGGREAARAPAAPSQDRAVAARCGDRGRDRLRHGAAVVCSVVAGFCVAAIVVFVAAGTGCTGSTTSRSRGGTVTLSGAPPQTDSNASAMAP